ncbi:hypothetical protein D1007_16305 [Hordeum vulgare]|nr:hypothetical protein D1007_16305 [Hordeum vulgare]
MTGLPGGIHRVIGLLSSRRCRLWPRRRRSLRRRRLLEGLLEWLAVRLRWGFLSRWLRSPSPPSAWASGQCSREDKMCINYGCAGHFRSESEAPPQCPTTLAYLGYRTERGSGYVVDAKIEEEVSQPHLASVPLAPEQVLPPGLVISADLIQVELAAYIGDFGDSEFTWEVTEMAPLVFSVPFPSTDMLWVSSHDFIRFPTNKFLISVHAAVAEPELFSPLERLWVLVYGLPRGGLGAPRAGKLTHILKAISEPVGKRVTVDLASFEDDGPARIEILCPAPAEIDGMSLIFYFGSRGRHLTFELESPTAADLHGSIPDATLPRDDGRDGDGARLRRAPSVRRMMVMAGSRRPRLMAGVPRSLLLLALPAMPEWLPGWRLGLGPWSSTGLLMSSLAWGGLLFSLAGVPFPSLRIPGLGAVAAPGLCPAGCDPEAAVSKARGEASPVVSARQSARLSQSRILLDGRVTTIQEKGTLRVAARDLSPEVATDSGIVF